MTRRAPAVAAVAALLLAPGFGRAQTGRPRASVTPVVEAEPARPGASLTVRLDVTLPPDVHVQAHEPRDPLLIPTVLDVKPPGGVTVEDIRYPMPSELTQAGRTEALLVLGPRFSIDVRLAVPSAAEGELVVPAVLRYQACNDAVCFPPARTSAEWRLSVARPDAPRH